MSDSIKLISLNLEGRRHLELQVPFFQSESPDILCLQEVFESDFDFFKKTLGMEGQFAPMCTERYVNDQGEEVFEYSGIAILTKLPIKKMRADYYLGSPDLIHEYVNNKVSSQEQVNKVFLSGDVLGHGDRKFSIGTTHFTWTPNGQADDLQRRDVQRFFEKLAAVPELVFCGDFNAPRGREIFTAIAKKYKDNIPVHYTTSIDGNLHRNGKLEYLVDGLFSTPEYQVTNVRLRSGVSDHCAIVAEIAHEV